MPDQNYPWRLRLTHRGHSHIQVEWKGPWFHFDPYEPPDLGQWSVLTWNEPERTRGVRQAIRAGSRPGVIADPTLRTWLGEQGAMDDRTLGGTVDGVRIDAVEYEPIPYATAGEALRKTRAALVRPGTAARRLAQRVRLPDTRPVIVQLTFPDKTRLVHLNCSLHQGTDAEWLRQQQERFGGADQLLVGVDYGEAQAVMRHVPGFEAQQILVTDLVNDTRKALGLATDILTPTVDRLLDAGLNAHPFVEGAGYRWE